MVGTDVGIVKALVSFIGIVVEALVPVFIVVLDVNFIVDVGIAVAVPGVDVSIGVE